MMWCLMKIFGGMMQCSMKGFVGKLKKVEASPGRDDNTQNGQETEFETNLYSQTL